MNERVTIVIVSHNCRHALWDCLRKLMAGSTGDDVPSIIVVDNASSDDSMEILTKEFPGVELIQNEVNLGLAAAANQGIRARISDFILLLAPDTLLNINELEKLYDAIRLRPDVGICAPRMLKSDRSLHPTCLTFPKLSAMICEELGLSRLFPRSMWFSRYRMAGWLHDETREVELVSRSCLLVRRRALEHIGLFDEQFFARFEDADLCKRLAQGGWRVLFVADATAVEASAPIRKADRSEVLGHRYRDLFTFYRKHHPHWQLPVLRLFVQISSLFCTITGKREYWAIVKNVWKL